MKNLRTEYLYCLDFRMDIFYRDLLVDWMMKYPQAAEANFSPYVHFLVFRYYDYQVFTTTILNKIFNI